MEEKVEGVDFAVPNFMRKMGREPKHIAKSNLPQVLALLQDRDKVFPSFGLAFFDVKDGHKNIGIAFFK